MAVLKKKIEDEIIDICIKIARRGEGAMFIFGNKLKHYKFLVNQEIKPFNIVDNPKTAESLALQDGAVWIDTTGILRGYGLIMTKLEPVMNKGTRHASALAASKEGNTIFLVSQEDKKVKIFKGSEIVMQIDALEKGVENKVSNQYSWMESLGFGSLATIGTTLLPPAAGIAISPGIIFFGSAATYYLFSYLKNSMKKD